MCKYCEQNESLFYDKNSEGIREVVVEQDGTLSVCSNDYDREEMKKSMAIGFSFDESAKMAQYGVSIKIHYCPMCGRKLAERDGGKMDIKYISKEDLMIYWGRNSICIEFPDGSNSLAQENGYTLEQCLEMTDAKFFLD